MTIETSDTYRKKGFGKEFAWIDLANSEEWDGFGTREDHLEDASWLAIFLKHWGLHEGVLAETPDAGLAKLRAFLRHAAERLAAGKPLSSQDVAQVNAWLKVPARQKLIQSQSGLHLELVPVRSRWEWILARIATSFAEMLEDGERERLRLCPNGGCRWIFYDKTKGNTRIWCSDKSCGNRDRVRRARAKKK